MGSAPQTNVDVWTAIDRVKDRAPRFVTNLFATPAQIQAWLEEDVMTCTETGRCLLLFRRDRDFEHLFHMASSPEALAAGLSSLDGTTHRGPYAVDLVGRLEQTAPIAAIYQQHGFEPHATLVRMSLAVNPAALPGAPDADVEYARPADVPRVDAFLNRLLNRFLDQIPTEPQLLSLAQQNCILLVRRDGEIGGVLVFENAGVTRILRYWYVDSQYRDHGIGGKLLRTFLHLSAGKKRILLWVIAENGDAIAKYQHYGFAKESLMDQILLRC